MKKTDSLRNALWIGVAAILGLLLFVSNPHYGTEPKPENAPTFPHASMTIQRNNGPTYLYDIEVATSSEQEAYGLMFRRVLLQNTGMIFLYQSDQDIHMWMKNTFIPLDMLFVRRDGIIAKIMTHTIPFDLTPLSSGEPVRAVVEINGGDADRLGLEPGDKILFPPLTGQK
jgi:uncharacterized membrane protein (UPF0127 family)